MCRPILNLGVTCQPTVVLEDLAIRARNVTSASTNPDMKYGFKFALELAGVVLPEFMVE